jgi:hypothetical protein
MGAKAPSIPKYNPPTPPAYQPLDIGAVNRAAISADQQAYNLSDTDFAARHPELVAAQTAFQKQVFGDVTGQPAIPAAVQNQMMTAGLTQAAQSMGATGAFGTQGGSGPGSFTGGGGSTGGGGATGTWGAPTAGQAAVARNFGLNVSNYLQQQKQIGASELAMATSMFPRREFGIGGPGVAQGMITENTNKNNYNWGVFGAQVQAAQFQANQAAQQAGLAAGASNANTSAMMGLGGSLVSAAGAAAAAAVI